MFVSFIQVHCVCMFVWNDLSKGNVFVCLLEMIYPKALCLSVCLKWIDASKMHCVCMFAWNDLSNCIVFVCLFAMTQPLPTSSCWSHLSCFSVSANKSYTSHSQTHNHQMQHLCWNQHLKLKSSPGLQEVMPCSVNIQPVIIAISKEQREGENEKKIKRKKQCQNM